jgi:N-formylglutamate amidohydrolase
VLDAKWYRRGWDISQGNGPVLATAVHAGHQVRPGLEPRFKADAALRRREEDPMTGIWATAGDHVFRSYVSRFEIDLNRSRDCAVYRKPEDAWGIEVWDDPLSDADVERSLRMWDDYYAMMSGWLEGLIKEHGQVLLLDVHSYNHRRDGPFAQPAAQEDNPDIDLGVTTLDHDRFGPLLEAFEEELCRHEAHTRKLDVRRNVRYDDGGHWPEWVFAQYGDNIAAITLEYKKFYMDEWTGAAFLPVVEDLRFGLAEAVSRVKREFLL